MRTGNKYYKQNEYKVLNKEKYIGDKNPKYRSSWEERFCYYLDTNINIKKWGYECISITYYNPIDYKVHRYFPDFYYEAIDIKNKLVKYLIEVKPYEQTIPPKKPKNKRSQKRFLIEAKSFIINQYKWEAAKKFCASRGLIFQIITEKELFNSGE